MKTNQTFAGYSITSDNSYNIAIDGFGAGPNSIFVNTTIAKSANNTNGVILLLNYNHYNRQFIIEPRD